MSSKVEGRPVAEDSLQAAVAGGEHSGALCGGDCSRRCFATEFGLEHAARYGRAVFVDVRRCPALRIDSRTSCQSTIERFSPGPAYVDGW